MNKIITRSPSKINLYLKVLNKRDDGYHNIETSFQLINLADEMTFELSDEEIIIESNKDFLSDTNNSIYSSARHIKKMFNIKNGIKINLQKNIPIGAGLGGGSSNAASTIVALNKIWNIGLNHKELIEIGKNIGADVPFFIFGKNALGKGIGEELILTESINDNVLVIQPNIENSTKDMFDKLNLSSKKKISNYSDQNDFWDVYFEKSSDVRNFYHNNSEDYTLNLSGTGSCMFIRFSTKKDLSKILKKIPSNWRLFFCKPLQYSPICYIK